MTKFIDKVLTIIGLILATLMIGTTVIYVGVAIWVLIRTIL